MKTNQSKFQLVAIDRIKPQDITVSKLIKLCSEGKVLVVSFTSRGFTSRGFTKHIKNMTQHAKLQLNKLYRFKNLSSKNKIKLYLLLVRTKLLYRIIPLHTCSWTTCNVSKIEQPDLSHTQLKPTISFHNFNRIAKEIKPRTNQDHLAETGTKDHINMELNNS